MNARRFRMLPVLGAAVLLVLELAAVLRGHADEPSAEQIKHLIANIGATTTNRLVIAGREGWAITRPAIEELVKIGARAEPYLIDELNNPASQVRPDLVIVLGRMHSTAAVPHLLEALKTENANLRAECLSALGQIGDKTALDALRPFLHDHDIRLRYRVRHILMKLSGEDFGFDYQKWDQWWAKGTRTNISLRVEGEVADRIQLDKVYILRECPALIGDFWVPGEFERLLDEKKRPRRDQAE